jgi:alkylhydroperoxidase/carboxymuconolactone decarboxylase family protein YurZ
MIPRPYRQMHETHPEFMRAYESMGQAARQAGPLSDREVALVKLAISVGAGLEGAAHSHSRKAIEAGCSAEDLRHVALLSAPTIGFPTMMRAKTWVEDVLAKQSSGSGGNQGPRGSHG